MATVWSCYSCPIQVSSVSQVSYSHLVPKVCATVSIRDPVLFCIRSKYKSRYAVINEGDRSRSSGWVILIGKKEKLNIGKFILNP